MAASTIVVDDHPLVCEAIKGLLDSTDEFTWCGSASTELEAQELCERVAPDLAILDIELSGPSGIDVAKIISSRWQKCRLVIYSAHYEVHYVVRCLRAGAKGYISKNDPPEHLLHALACAMRDEIFIPESIRQEVLKLMFWGETADANTLVALSDRQLEVYRQIGNGRTTCEIADLLNLSPKTIRSHIQTIKETLGIPTLTQLRINAVRWQVNVSRKAERS